MIVRDHFLHDIGTRANHDAGIKITCIHINDAAVGVAQIVHQGGIGFAGGDGQYLTVGGHVHDLRVTGGAVVVFQQVIQALLDCRRVHGPAVGERNVVLQGNRPCQIAVIFP